MDEINTEVIERLPSKDALQALVSGRIDKLDDVGMMLSYPADGSASATALHDHSTLAALLDGVVVRDAPLGIVRIGDRVVLEQRWRIVRCIRWVAAQPETAEAPAAEPEAPAVTISDPPAA